VAGDVPQVAPEKQLRELLRDLREGLQLLDGSIAALGVPRAQGRRDHLLEALLPKLRSRNPEARQGALEDLHVLAELAQELSQLLFWRSLRNRVAE
jgi:uncharacterized membrane protein YccC